MWQQIGRSGRGQEASVAVLVAGDDQLDQWIMSHPDELLSRQPETAVINPANPFILGPHLACAAFEKPLSHADDDFWGDALDDGIRDLVLDDTVVLKPSGKGRRSRCTPGRGGQVGTLGFGPGPPMSFGSLARTARSSAPLTALGRSPRPTQVRCTCIKASHFA